MTEKVEKLSMLIRLGSGFNRCNFPSFCLKPLQAKCFEYLLKGKDIVAALPTGFGKSLLFQLYRIFCLSRRTIILCQMVWPAYTTSSQWKGPGNEVGPVGFAHFKSVFTSLVQSSPVQSWFFQSWRWRHFPLSVPFHFRTKRVSFLDCSRSWFRRASIGGLLNGS